MDQWTSYLSRQKARCVDVLQKYTVLGFIASGTYGKVYKASRKDSTGEFAIKKFKNEDSLVVRTNIFGISQSACRETSLCSELKHENIVGLEEIIVDPLDKSIYMIFEYAEHDLLQMLHYHASTIRTAIPIHTVKSILWQLLKGVEYLHSNWVLHRDLKPANILVTSNGIVKIGIHSFHRHPGVILADLGLARLYCRPLQPLGQTDRVVVTIWYRAPELLLHSKHYTPAIDIWAVGCIFAELLIMRPLFKGDEVKSDGKNLNPFQSNQMEKLVSILGSPSAQRWPEIVHCSEYNQLKNLRVMPNILKQFIMQNSMANISENGIDLLCKFLEYDPNRRITATDALKHPYFDEEPKPLQHVFKMTHNAKSIIYPKRIVTHTDTDLKKDETNQRKRKNSN